MDNNEVLAVVGGRNITQKDYEYLLRNMDQKTAIQFYSTDGKKKLVNELISQELLYLDAIENKLDIEDDFVKEMDRIKSNLLKQYAVAKLLDSVTVGEDEVKAFYNANMDAFKSGQSVRASHILVDSEDKAFEVLEEINNGLSFEGAAAEYSSCPSKSNGGDLGHFTMGKMVPEFEAAAFELEIGDTSIPVKTQFGYHIIKVTEKKEEEIKSFDEIRENLIKQLTADKHEEVYSSKVNELMGKYEIKKNI